jgi:hypothetical protein
MVIAEHVDAISDGHRRTAVVEAQRENAVSPHLVFIISIEPAFIGPLLEFAANHPAARIPKRPAEIRMEPLPEGGNGITCPNDGTLLDRGLCLKCGYLYDRS